MLKVVMNSRDRDQVQECFTLLYYCRPVQHAEVRLQGDLTGLSSSSEVWILAPSTIKANIKFDIGKTYKKYFE